MLRISLISILVLLLQACGSSAPKPVAEQSMRDDGGVEHKHNSLSAERIQEIRQAFIGQAFVLNEDWYEYSIIDSDPVGGFSQLVPRTRLADWAERRGHRRLVAQRGSVGKIVGMRSFRSELVMIAEMKPHGQRIYLVLLNHRPTTLLMGRNRNKVVQRDALSDKVNTVDWVAHNLGYQALELLRY